MLQGTFKEIVKFGFWIVGWAIGIFFAGVLVGIYLTTAGI